MKPAIIRQRRTDPRGQQVVQVVCPRCEHRHWFPADMRTAICPRNRNAITIRTA
jgi:hypothetical protein